MKNEAEIKRLLDLFEQTGNKEYHRQACLLVDPQEFATLCIRRPNK